MRRFYIYAIIAAIIIFISCDDDPSKPGENYEYVDKYFLKDGEKKIYARYYFNGDLDHAKNLYNFWEKNMGGYAFWSTDNLLEYYYIQYKIFTSRLGEYEKVIGKYDPDTPSEANYYYDQDGKLIKLTNNWDLDPEFEREYKLFYENGLPEKVEYYNSGSLSYTEYFLYESGAIKKYWAVNPKGDTLNTVEIIFDNASRKITAVYSSGKLKEYYFDDDGLMEKVVSLSGGEVTSTFYYEHNSGLLYSVLDETGFAFKRYEYNKERFLIKEILQSKAGSTESVYLYEYH